MTLLLEFKHHHSLVRSVAIFNLEQPQPSVMIMPYSHKNELGNTIIFKQDNQHWVSESFLETQFNSTYLNMVNEIDAVIKKHTIFSEVWLQQFLS